MADITGCYFSLLRHGLRTQMLSGAPAGLSEGEWQELYDLSVRQGTAALVWDALQELQAATRLPQALRLQWACNVGQIERRYERQKKALADIAGFYAGHAIPLMLLKGYGLSLCYPCPEHRPCGDIDIWLFGKQREADDLLRRERHIRVDGDKHHHTVFFIDGIMVENHYDFLNVHSHASNRVADRLLKQYVGAPGEPVRVGDAEVFLPAPRFNAFFLLRHAAVHFAAAGIGIRHVADWAMFIRRYHAMIDWPELRATARRVNMHRFLWCMNALAIDCLGLDAALFPAFKRDPELETRVLNDILYPEFGEKSPQKGFFRISRFKIRRWLANRWKHRIVYSESLAGTFFRQVYSHLLKPASLVR